MPRMSKMNVSSAHAGHRASGPRPIQIHAFPPPALRFSAPSAGLILAALVLVGCSDSGTGPQNLGVVFPLREGNTWTYASEDPQLGESFQWEVTGRSADTVTLSRPWAGSHPGPVTLIDKEDSIEIILGGGRAWPLYRFQRGSTWIRHDPWDCDDRSEWVAMEEEEPIVTPAGTFHNTLRLERRTSANCTDAGTMIEWWAPGVGLVRWEELNFYAGGPLGFELVAYGGPFQ